jgi:hypothetical protein
MIGKDYFFCRPADLNTSEIFGMWEVLKIIPRNDEPGSFHWKRDRFIFNFLSEKIFLCIRDGKTLHGPWKLSETGDEKQKRFSIILNDTYEFSIESCTQEEMILSDQRNDYLLVRRL